ncbi:hypothetical protein [Sphingomonas humi]|uniref:GIY-YIG nuclease family protein n=1 Tax=Sphingomonas humi TaxID=335630 RepID=A0ABP7SCT6_9SPHN
MSAPSRRPGWDKQAVNAIAKEQYGGLAAMFAAHGWNTDGRVISQIAPTKVKDNYGSVEAFVLAHRDGASENPILDPMAAIRSDPPEVWLTSLYGFTTESWGFFGFTEERMRTAFINKSRPGALVVVYAAGGAPAELRGKVLGVQQISHRTGLKWDFLAPERMDAERADADRRDKWLYAIQLLRGWRVPFECRPNVEQFAPETYKHANARAIGSMGLRLTKGEAEGLLNLTLIEIPVYGGGAVEMQLPSAASIVLSPSRPGPVSQRPHLTREAEGPKHLYILGLDGNADHFLGYPSDQKAIVKVGFSVSPQTRCDAHNGSLPACAFKWSVRYSTYLNNRTPFPSSRHALAGEAAMKDALRESGKSLGGEFFLADHQSIERAWMLGLRAAERWTDA